MTRRLLVIGLLAAATAPAGGQWVHADVITTATTHPQMASPLVGASLSLGQVSSGRATLRLSAEYSGGTSSRLGSTCYGLVPATADCSPKPLNDRARIFLLNGSFEVGLARSGRMSLGVFGDAGIGRGSMLTHEPGQSGYTTYKVLIDGVAGVTARWHATDRWGVRVKAGAGGAVPYHAGYTVMDGPPDAFRDGFHVARLSIGVFWTPPLG